MWWQPPAGGIGKGAERSPRSLLAYLAVAGEQFGLGVIGEARHVPGGAVRRAARRQMMGAQFSQTLGVGVRPDGRLELLNVRRMPTLQNLEGNGGAGSAHGR